MTVRTPLAEVLNTPLNQPDSANMVFMVSQGSVELSLTAAKAGLLLANKGAQGITGAQGRQGTQGVQGRQGTTGSNGSQGITGSQGMQGVQGRIGAQGTTGSQGVQGRQGTQGVQGRQGTTGSGTQGVQGVQGRDGVQGIRGVDGTSSGGSGNVAGGIAGNIPIQSGTSSTTFIPTGNNGNLLQYANSTATWISTASLLVSNSQASEQTYVTILPVVGRTGDQYITMVNGGTGYYAAGIQSDIKYNVTNKLLTTPNLTVSSSTIASSTITGALIVTGGVGIGGKIYTGSTVNIAGKDNAISTITGALVVAGGVGIGQDLRVGGTIYGTLSGSISIASNLSGGSAGKIAYQSSPNVTAFVDAGTTGYLLTANNTSAPTWKNTSTLIVGYSVSVMGGAAGSVLYQTANNTTGKLVLGNPGEVLTVNPGGTAPYWTTIPTSGGGGAVDTATTATHLAGGLSGKVPYQISAGRTGFTAAGSVGEILTSGGTGSPTWKSASTIFGGAANLSGGTAMSIVYQSSAGATAFLAAGTDGQVLQTHGTGSVPTWTSVSAITGVTTATNLANGAAGSIPIQSAPGITAFIPIGTVGHVLTSDGSTAAWTAPATGVSSTTTATNLANGSLGQVPYQTGAGLTSFFGPGSLGQLLVSQGAAAPLYVNTSSIRVGYATNLANGTAGQFPYQVSPGNTRFTGPGTAGQLLISDGTNGPYFINTSSVSVGWAAVAGSVAPGALIQGIQGIQGSQGTQGPQGTQGILGTQGALGVQGSQGNQGTQGTTGLQGVTAAIGNTYIAVGNTTSIAGDTNLTWNGSVLNVNGEIRAIGEITAYYGSPSDIRLKTKIESINNGLEKVISLSGVTYDWNELAGHRYGGLREAGVIAQEIQKVLPEAVVEKEDGFLTVKYDRIIPLLIQAIKELSTEVNELKKKIG